MAKTVTTDDLAMLEEELRALKERLAELEDMQRKLKAALGRQGVHVD